MANRDRRAQRKAKKRQERIRQNKHQATFGFGFGDYGDYHPEGPIQMPRIAINVHHVPGGRNQPRRRNQPRILPLPITTYN